MCLRALDYVRGIPGLRGAQLENHYHTSNELMDFTHIIIIYQFYLYQTAAPIYIPGVEDNDDTLS